MKVRFIPWLFASLLGSCQLLVERFGPDTCEGDARSCVDGIQETCVDGFIKKTDCGERGCLADFDSCDLCGDAIVQAELGEACDDDNFVAGDGCDAACQVEAGFTCLGAPSVCVVSCGNGTLDPGEGCDDGNDILTDDCPSGPGGSCQDAFCGDLLVIIGSEECDDGRQCTDGTQCQSNDECNGIGDSTCLSRSGDGCTNDCIIEACGDGVINGGAESCDDGNANTGDGCRPDCTIEFCGDSVVDPQEICDGNTNGSGDACRADCQNFISCGSGLLDIDEECEDGNTTNGDGCSSACQIEECGDGAVNNNGVEQCDDGNTIGGDDCDASCFNELCGNSIVSFNQNGAPEQCDDGNSTNGDGCNSQCQFEACGDGALGQGEDCDDGNIINFDGCTLCQIDPGFICTAEPSDCIQACGNGVLDPDEECDDNDTTANDGCTLCEIDDGFLCSGAPSNCVLACGNGVINAGEQCDDGNTTNGDGCDADCLRTCDKIAAADGFPLFATDTSTGHCYLRSSQLLGWTAARNDCASLGNATFPGHLVTLTSSAENTFVRNIDLAPAIWIGATDQLDGTLGSQEDQWRWLTRERLSYFINFRNGEPNDSGGNQDCAAYFGASLDWDDDDCNALKTYICEIDFGKQCGNGISEQGELCDDNNTTNGDGCASNCSAFSCNDELNAGGAEGVSSTFSGGCFVRFSTDRTFDAAQADCIARGGFLATATVDNENAVLDAIEGGDNAFWIGLRDIITEGAFQWINGEIFGFEDFSGNPPANNNDDCVEYNTSDAWDDINCGNTRDYVCEF